MISLDPLKVSVAAEPDAKTAVAKAMHALLDMADAAWKVDVASVRDVVATWRQHVDAVAEAAVTPPPMSQGAPDMVQFSETEEDKKDEPESHA